jgi:hypothetical protein
MTLTLFLFLLGLAGVLLVSLPLSIMIAEMEHDMWINIRFWAVVAAMWAAVWVVMS